MFSNGRQGDVQGDAAQTRVGGDGDMINRYELDSIRLKLDYCILCVVPEQKHPTTLGHKPDSITAPVAHYGRQAGLAS